jgi:hypothetical protein
MEYVMPMNIEGKENIRDIFSIFHDGVISSCQFRHGELCLEVEIQYLAELINSAFKKFQVSLKGVENIRFTTWPSDLKSEPQLLCDVSIIFEPKLDILEGNIKENQIQVVCNQASSNYDYCSGELYFSAVSAVVIDEAVKSYSIEELDSLCKDYWDAWANKNQCH